MVEIHAEASPMVFGDDIETVGGGFQGADFSVDEPEVLQDATQLRAEPEGSGLSVYLLEDKQSPSLFRIVARPFDDAHHSIYAAIAIDITRLELIDGVGQPPVVQPIETVVLLAQRETVSFL